MARISRKPTEEGTHTTPAPAPVGTTVSAAASGTTLLDTIRQFAEQDWETHMLYIYRRWPRISKTDNPHYIDTVRQAVDERWLLEQYGSGRYTIRLNNPRKTIATQVVEVHAMDKPPKLELAELMDCPENARFHELWPRKKEVVTTAANNDIQPAADSIAVAELAKVLNKVLEKQPNAQTDDDRRISSQVLEWALKQTTEERTSDAPGKLAEMLRAVKELIPTQQPAAAPVADPVSTIEKMVNIVDKLNRPHEKEDPLEMVERVMGLVEKLRPDNSRAAEQLRPDTTNVSAIERIGSLVVNLLQPAVPIIGNALVNRWMQPPGMSALGSPAQTAVTVVPAAASAVSAAAQQAPPLTEEGMVADRQLQMLRQFLPYIQGPLIKYLNDGRTGADFADWISDSYGEMALAQLQQLPKEVILQAASLEPSLSQVMQTVPVRFEMFVSEIINPETVEAEPEADVATA